MKPYLLGRRRRWLPNCDWSGRSTCYIEGVVENALPIPPPGFDDLNVDDQIEYVQALWDRIAAKEDVVPVPDWHRDILDERLADLEANPDAGRPWEEVKANLLNTTRAKE